MRVLRSLVSMLVVALTIVPPVSARVVRVETTVALADHSGPSIEQAVRRALDTSVRGAVAMGLSLMWVDEARVLSDAVVLRLIATDEESDGEGQDQAPKVETSSPTWQ